MEICVSVQLSRAFERAAAGSARGPMKAPEIAVGVRHGYLRHLAAVIEPQPEVSK